MRRQVSRSPAFRERIPSGQTPVGCKNPRAEERAEAGLGAWMNSTGSGAVIFRIQGDCPF
ncbi:hypothetical protein ACLBWT_17700 [Paenibacillus sp. D51F]